MNLEENISRWRERMLAAGIKTPVPLKELELHLREEIEREIKAGLGEAEAFRMAVANIGPAHALRSEFEQAEQIEELLRSKSGQFKVIALLGAIQLLVIAAVLFNSEMTFGQRLSGLAAIATGILFAVVVGWSHRFFPVIQNRWRRLIVCFVAGMLPYGLWFSLCVHFFLVGHEFPFGQWLASTLWSTAPPLGIYLGVIIGFETAARNKMVTAK